MIDKAVADSTCLIVLERIGHLNLLPEIFSTVFAPPAVQEELGTSPDWLIVRTVRNTAMVAALQTQLGKGESQSIALATEIGGVYVISDDKKARRIANQMGIRVIGTLGALLLGKRKGLISAIKPLLDAIRQSGFHMTPSLYEEALRLAGELPGS